MSKTDKNNLGTKLQREISAGGAVEKGRAQAELERFSLAGNVRTEKAWPKPNYSVFKRDAVTPADASPASTPPDDSKCWDLTGYSGLHGYAIFSGGTTPSVDLELWVKDEQNNAWFLAAFRPSIFANEELRFAEEVRGRKVFLRVAALSGAPTNVTLRCSPE